MARKAEGQDNTSARVVRSGDACRWVRPPTAPQSNVPSRRLITGMFAGASSAAKVFVYAVRAATVAVWMTWKGGDREGIMEGVRIRRRE